MNRIGMFVFYDADGHVDDYICVLLNSMQEFVQKLVIIINGTVNSFGYNRLNQYSDKIFIRENHGYDAGAYKDAFTKFLVDEQWENWDEIILFNDTFYGPIYSWKQIIDEMKEEKADFWGLSRHLGGEGKLMTGREMPAHIQSYFLVCNKHMFLSPCWYEFWDTLQYPETYREAVEKFEVHFSEYFFENGYKGKAFTDKSNINIAYGSNPCIRYFYQLIKDARFPIIKKRAVCLENLLEAKKAAEYITNHTDYDVKLISAGMKRLCGQNRINPIAPFDPVFLEEHYNRHERVFIYGHGNYGKGIAEYFRYKGWKFCGFVVSDNRENEDVSEYRDMHFNPKDGLILALGEKAFYEVYPIVKKDLDAGQLCYPQYEFNMQKIGNMTEEI